MKFHVYHKRTLVNGTLNNVFDFFSKAENLNLLTPPDLKFIILTASPIVMQLGTQINYKLSLNGISFGWRTEITGFEPPLFFEDTQVRGPYRIWKHRHHFEAYGNQTIMTDEVRYLSPGYFLEPLINRLFIKKKVERIFEYREKKLSEIFV